MESKYKRISQIENVVSQLLAKSGASEHFFINNLPKEINKKWEDMIYVELNVQSDKNAYTIGSANIFLYSKPTGSYYRKNVKVMDAMEDKMNNALAEFTHPHYTIMINWRDSDYDKTLEFYFNVINIQIISK